MNCCSPANILELIETGVLDYNDRSISLDPVTFEPNLVFYGRRGDGACNKIDYSVQYAITFEEMTTNQNLLEYEQNYWQNVRDKAQNMSDFYKLLNNRNC